MSVTPRRDSCGPVRVEFDAYGESGCPRSSGADPGLTTGRVHRAALCLFEIGRVEAFCEPAVDRQEKLAGFGRAALVVGEPGEAHSGPQFPNLGPLLPSDAERFRYCS